MSSHARRHEPHGGNIVLPRQNGDNQSYVGAHMHSRMAAANYYANVQTSNDLGAQSDYPAHAHVHKSGYRQYIGDYSDSTLCIVFAVVAIALTTLVVAVLLSDSTSDGHAVHVIIDPAPLVSPIAPANGVFRTDDGPRSVDVDASQGNAAVVATPSLPVVTCPPSEQPERDPATGHVTGRCKATIRAPNGTHPDMVDWSVVPKANFYRFGSGAWINAAPAGSSRFFQVASEHNTAVWSDLIDVAVANTINPLPLGSFMQSCLRQHANFAIDAKRARLADLASFAAIDADVALLSTGSEDRFDVMRAIATWHQRGHMTPFHFSSTASLVQSKQLVLFIESLDYNVLDSIPEAEQADAVGALLANYDADGRPIASPAQQHVKTVIQISKLLVSRASRDFSSVDLPEYVRRYYSTHTFTPAELAKHFAVLNWRSFFGSVALASQLSADDTREWLNWIGQTDVWIWDTEQMAILDASVRQFSIEEWKAYFLFLARIGMGDVVSTLWSDAGVKFVARSASALRPSHHANEHIGQHRPTRAGVKPTNAHLLWRQAPLSIVRAAYGAVELVHVDARDGPSTSSSDLGPDDSSSGSAFSTLDPHELVHQGARDFCEEQAHMYLPTLIDDMVARAVLTDAKRTEIHAVVTDLIESYVKYVQLVPGLSVAGRAALVSHFRETVIRVGNADFSQIRGGEPYAGLLFTGDYWQNVLAGRAATARHEVQRCSAPFVAWQKSVPLSMAGIAVNAYCNVRDQTITLLPGILLKPFVGNSELAYSDASLFAGIGAIVGHELWHLVDAHGRIFDNGGSLLPWLPLADNKVFDEYDNWIIATYAVALPITGEIARSRQQVGEAAADVMGLTASYAALAARGSPSTQSNYEFCLFYAQMWASVETADSVHARNVDDPHPVGEVRVNMATRALPVWAGLFGKQLLVDRPRMLRV